MIQMQVLTGGRIAHTFDTATETEQQFTVQLKLDSMSTANPKFKFSHYCK